MEMLLIHLHAGVKRAQILVERCCYENSSWLSTTSNNLIDIKEEVISILLDHQQWIFMLNRVVVSLGGTCSFKVDDGLKLLKDGEETYQRLLKKMRSSEHELLKQLFKITRRCSREIQVW